MRVAAILVCAIAAVLGNDIEIDIDLSVLKCPLDLAIQTFFPHEHCGMFYQCSNGVVVEQQCSGNLLFDLINQQCDWPYKVDCTGRNTTEPKPKQDESAETESEEGGDNDTCNCDPAEAPEICAQSNSDGVLVAHEYCNYFFKCANQVPISLKCPRGLYFNPYTRWCDWPKRVDCGNRTISNNDDEDTDGNENDNGSNEDTQEIVDNDHVDAEEVCAQQESDGVLIAHEYCNMFYTCSDKQLFAQRCPDNLVYNPSKELCDWSKYVNCGNKTIAEPENNDNGSDEGSDEPQEIVDNDHVDAAEVCAQQEIDGVLIAHEYCNMFYTCSGKQLYAQRCPDNLVFNPSTGVCDWAEYVNCGNKTIADPENNDNGSDEDNNDTQEVVDNDHVDAAQVCAQQDSDGVLVAHEYCNLFYKCSGNQLVAQRCPDSLVYNPSTGLCDWPIYVNCGNKTIAEPENNDNGSDEGSDEPQEIVDNDHVDAAEVCAQQEIDGVIIAHEYCNMFYTCSGKQLYAQRCPDNLVFNPSTGVCDWAEYVNCGNKTIAEPENNDNGSDEDNNDTQEVVDNEPVDAAQVCAQQDSDGVLVAHEYCNMFYKCSSNQLVAHRCPDGLVYNPSTGLCDWPEYVNCGNKTIAEPVNNDNGSDEGNNEPQEIVDNDHVDAAEVCAQQEIDGVLIAHEYCNMFYTCSGKQLFGQRCPDGLVYNPSTELCDWSEFVNCGNKTIAEPEINDNGSDEDNNENEDNSTTVGPINDDPAEARAICAQDESDGILIAHENCDHFYICNLFVPVTIKCGKDLYFNANNGRCDWPENVDCGDRVIPTYNDTDSDGQETLNLDPSEAPEICARDGSDGVLIAHENCNQYYKCYQGEPNALKCSGNYMYNAYKGWCDWAENVDCGDRIVPDNNDSSENGNPTMASEICAREESEGILVAHEICSQFFKCSHGVPVELQCGNGLQYNPDLGICDWPSQVDCGDRKQ